jgi:hypothetical protein
MEDSDSSPIRDVVFSFAATSKPALGSSETRNVTALPGIMQLRRDVGRSNA